MWNKNKLLEALKKHNPNIVVKYTRKEKNTMKVTLKNGLVLEGTPEQVSTVARTFGEVLGNDGVHYMSNSRGLVRIDSMDEAWLRNAIAKRVREWSETLRTLDNATFVRAVTNGPADVTTAALVARLAFLTSRVIKRY